MSFETMPQKGTPPVETIKPLKLTPEEIEHQIALRQNRIPEQKIRETILQMREKEKEEGLNIARKRLEELKKRNN